jgi:hypothetical protein
MKDSSLTKEQVNTIADIIREQFKCRIPSKVLLEESVLLLCEDIPGLTKTNEQELIDEIYQIVSEI